MFRARLFGMYEWNDDNEVRDCNYAAHELKKFVSDNFGAGNKFNEQKMKKKLDENGSAIKENERTA